MNVLATDAGNRKTCRSHDARMFTMRRKPFGRLVGATGKTVKSYAVIAEYSIDKIIILCTTSRNTCSYFPREQVVNRITTCGAVKSGDRPFCIALKPWATPDKAHGVFVCVCVARVKRTRKFADRRGRQPQTPLVRALLRYARPAQAGHLRYNTC